MDVNYPKNNTLKNSKRRNNYTRRLNSKAHRLDYEDKGLKELPVKNENWEFATELNLRGNNLIVLYAYALPENLVTLDVRDCEIKYIIGGFPKTLKTLKLDRNDLKYLPDIPPTVKYTIKHNPISDKTVKDVLGPMLAIKEKTIYWITVDTNERQFKEKERAHINFFSEGDFEIITTTMYLILDLTRVCHRLIDKAHFDTAFILGSRQHIILEIEDGRVIAFSIFNIEPTHIEIQIICSATENRGGGTRIFNTIKGYFTKHKGLEKIKLDSIDEAKGYYEKLGFRLKKEFEEMNENGTVANTYPMEFHRS